VFGARPDPLTGLVDALLRYKHCIIEKYESDRTIHIAIRDQGVSCADGSQCSLASRISLFQSLATTALKGDANTFQGDFRRSLLADCFECARHGTWHTKHVHCTESCGGNNGVFEGPCFLGCKALRDLTDWAKKAVDDVRRWVKTAVKDVGNFLKDAWEKARHVLCNVPGVSAICSTVDALTAGGKFIQDLAKNNFNLEKALDSYCSQRSPRK
jgi:hypothetical protein